MKLIVGLGNPGTQYARTRHNAGFMALERLARRHGLLAQAVKARFHAAVLDGPIAGNKCVLFEPQTFMNRSGRAVQEALAFYKLEPADLIVLVDDVALPTGRIRLRAAGSAGGHNGLADIERALSTADYPRLRIGIDAPPPRVAQSDYVLGRFSPDELDRLDPALNAACDAVEAWITDGIDKAMSIFNARE